MSGAHSGMWWSKAQPTPMGSPGRPPLGRREHRPLLTAAPARPSEADFKAACRALTADLARKYADHLTRGTRTTMACSMPTSRSLPWRRSTAWQANSTGKPTSLHEVVR